VHETDPFMFEESLGAVRAEPWLALFFSGFLWTCYHPSCEAVTSPFGENPNTNAATTSARGSYALSHGKAAF
jgi:hypothetical protein